jgi:hypothetical protein
VLLRLAWLLVDLILCAGVLAAFLIAATGGTEFTIQGHQIRAHSVGNLLAGLSLLTAGRYWAGRRTPFLGILAVAGAADHAGRLLEASAERLERLTSRRAAQVVAVFAAAVLALKAANALIHPGFFSGDDVEVHEMTLGHLFGRAWPVWDLRSAFYPMAFIYPVQACLASMGVTDAGTLVVAGRLVVVALSTLMLPLLYSASKRAYGTQVAIAAVAFASFSGLNIDLGSTELPRPVSTVVVLAAFRLLMASTSTAGASAGVLLGVAATLRFSEAVFAVPALIQLAGEKRFRSAFLLIVGWLVTVAAIQSLSDWLFWGEAFHSARAIVDFTLVKGLSSRGYEPVWYYLTTAPLWTNLLVCVLAAVGTASGHWRPALWAWAPIGLLSLLPHKEFRYLIPALPFVFMLAGLGFASTVAFARRRSNPWALALLLAFPANALIEMARFHVRRTDGDVRLARAIAVQASNVGVLAVEQRWRMGGQLYLGNLPAVIDIPAEWLGEQSSLLALVKNRGVDGLAIRDETCRRLRCQDVLPSSGFAEQSFGTRGETDFRYFHK